MTRIKESPSALSVKSVVKAEAPEEWKSGLTNPRVGAKVYRMSKAEILDEILKLTPEERDEIRQKLDDLDDDSLTPEQWALVDARMEAHRRDPASAIPWEEFDARLKRRLGE